MAQSVKVVGVAKDRWLFFRSREPSCQTMRLNALMMVLVVPEERQPLLIVSRGYVVVQLPLTLYTKGKSLGLERHIALTHIQPDPRSELPPPLHAQ